MLLNAHNPAPARGATRHAATDVPALISRYVGRVVASANQVAAALREHLPGVEGGKLYRLLYYIQGHHLALHGRPAFTNPIVAGPDGPEIPDLGEPAGTADPGDAAQSCAVLAVTRYGGLTAADLNRLTCAEAPWRDTTPGQVISHDRLAEFFRGPGAQEGVDRFTPEYLAKVGKEVKQATTRAATPVDPATLFAAGGRR